MPYEQTQDQSKLLFWRCIFLTGFGLYCANNTFLYFIVGESLSMQAAFALLAIKIVPLLCFFPQLLKPNFKAAVAFCCLLLFYFSFVAFSMFQEGIRGYLAILEGLLLTSMFWAAYKLGKLH